MHARDMIQPSSPRIDRLKKEWSTQGISLCYTKDEKGTGWVMYDPKADRETGPSWVQPPGRRMTLDEIDRALGELKSRPVAQVIFRRAQ